MQFGSASAANSPQLDEKKVFEVHLDCLRDAYKELIDANQKILGILLIVMGWFGANKNPLGMLCHVPHMVYLAIAFTVAGFFALAYLFNIIFERADASYLALTELGYDQRLFSRFRVSRPMYWTGLFGQSTLLIDIVASLAVKYIILVDRTCP